jgi:hypothetical protein
MYRRLKCGSRENVDVAIGGILAIHFLMCLVFVYGV